MFSLKFTLIPLIIKKITSLSSKIVLAPRGMLHKYDITQKRGKKNLYLFLTRTFYTNKIIFYFWQTTIMKKNQIESSFYHLNQI